MIDRLRSPGRGTNYSPLRGLIESALTLAYKGRWPGKAWGSLARASRIQEFRHRLEVPGGERGRFRIAFLSDLHIGPTTAPEVLQRAFAMVEEARPDALLLGGDYVTFEATDGVLAELVERLASLSVPHRYGVMGNHDLWTHDDRIAEALEAGGVRVLVNQPATLPAPWQDIAVIGLDEPRVGQCDASAAFRGVSPEAFRLVLCHSPDGLLACSEHDFDFYLCGHTHGGQIATPWGPVLLPKGALCRKYHAGLQEHEGVGVFVSRGLGCTEIPARAFARPDILILDLVDEGEASRSTV